MTIQKGTFYVYTIILMPIATAFREMKGETRGKKAASPGFQPEERDVSSCSNAHDRHLRTRVPSHTNVVLEGTGEDGFVYAEGN